MTYQKRPNIFYDFVPEFVPYYHLFKCANLELMCQEIKPDNVNEIKEWEVLHQIFAEVTCYQNTNDCPYYVRNGMPRFCYVKHDWIDLCNRANDAAYLYFNNEHNPIKERFEKAIFSETAGIFWIARFLLAYRQVKYKLSKKETFGFLDTSERQIQFARQLLRLYKEYPKSCPALFTESALFPGFWDILPDFVDNFPNTIPTFKILFDTNNVEKQVDYLLFLKGNRVNRRELMLSTTLSNYTKPPEVLYDYMPLIRRLEEWSKYLKKTSLLYEDISLVAVQILSDKKIEFTPENDLIIHEIDATLLKTLFHENCISLLTDKIIFKLLKACDEETIDTFLENCSRSTFKLLIERLRNNDKLFFKMVWTFLRGSD